MQTTIEIEEFTFEDVPYCLEVSVFATWNESLSDIGHYECHGRTGYDEGHRVIEDLFLEVEELTAWVLNDSTDFRKPGLDFSNNNSFCELVQKTINENYSILDSIEEEILNTT